MEPSIESPDAIPYDALTVTDLKNYAHCPRITFFEKCLPDIRPRVYNMDAGEEAHEEERARAKRRKLTMYGLPDGERRFNLRLYHPGLNLVGVLDELVIGPDGIYYPVDYKLSSKVSESFKWQITAYALLIETHFSARVTAGFIFLISQRQLERVAVTPALRASVIAAVESIRAMIDRERMPPPVAERAKCSVCEFRRFCNDV